MSTERGKELGEVVSYLERIATEANQKAEEAETFKVLDLIEVTKETMEDEKTKTPVCVHVVRNWIVLCEEERDVLAAKGYTYVESRANDGAVLYLFPKVKVADLLEILPTSPLERQMAWLPFEEALRRHFQDPEIEGVKILCASVAAHYIRDYPPVWPLLIAPSGSMKTAIVESLRGMSGIHFFDEVTPQTFISGMLDKPGSNRNKAPSKKPSSKSLLHRIGKDGIVVMSDFSTVLSGNRENRERIFSQLRRIYDGNLRREFGTDEHLEEREWDGRLSVIACVTPEVDRQQSVFQALGERFIRLRWGRAGGVAAGVRAMQQNTSRVKAELHSAMQRFILPVIGAGQVAAPSAEDYWERISALGELVALARTHVQRDGYNRNIEELPEPEGNTRLPQQFAQIGRGWAALEGRDALNDDDFTLIRRIGLDSIPPARRAVLVALIGGRSPYEKDGNVPAAKSVTNRALEDLEMLGLAERDPSAGKSEWILSAKAVELIRLIRFPECPARE